MDEQATFGDRKRPHEETQLTQQAHFFKRTKYSPPATGFWENLSQIWLTTDAIRELNRRNALKATSAIHVPRHRPITRSIRRRWLAQNCNQFALQPEDVAVGRCSSDSLNKIKAFASGGGPDLTDLRGFVPRSDPLVYTMSSEVSRSRGRKRSVSKGRQTETTKTKSSGPYSRNFQQALIDGGVYPNRYKFPNGKIPPRPDNWEDIQARLALRRSSLSPSQFTEKDFETFLEADAHASKERQVTETVIPILEGKILDARRISGGIPLTNLDPLLKIDLVSSNPDRYYGARPEQLDSLIRTELSGHIIPSTQHDLPIVPNFFLAVKGPDGSLAVAGRQASYDGALGARGFESLRLYGGNGVNDNKAYAITSIYHGGTLKMFTSHPSQSATLKGTSKGTSKGRPEYFMNQIKSSALTNDLESFRQGATWYRNGRDWAKEIRDDAIRNANKVLAASKETETSSETSSKADEALIPESEGVTSSGLSYLSPDIVDDTQIQERHPKRSCQSLSLEKR